jgi:hypothetical protein
MAGRSGCDVVYAGCAGSPHIERIEMRYAYMHRLYGIRAIWFKPAQPAYRVIDTGLFRRKTGGLLPFLANHRLIPVFDTSCARRIALMFGFSMVRMLV